MKIEKRITEKEFKEVLATGSAIDDIYEMCSLYHIQELKDMITEDADFEIIEPKQLTAGE